MLCAEHVLVVCVVYVVPLVQKWTIVIGACPGYKEHLQAYKDTTRTGGVYVQLWMGWMGVG